jgi:hypothetical protein
MKRGEREKGCYVAVARCVDKEYGVHGVLTSRPGSKWQPWGDGTALLYLRAVTRSTSTRAQSFVAPRCRLGRLITQYLTLPKVHRGSWIPPREARYLIA